MTVNERVFTAALAVAVGVVTAFVVTAVPPPIFYVPAKNLIVIGVKPSEIVVAYYGRVALTIIGTGAGAVLGRALRRFASKRLVLICLSWAGLGATLFLTYWIFQLWGRALTPAALPPGYIPR